MKSLAQSREIREKTSAYQRTIRLSVLLLTVSLLAANAAVAALERHTLLNLDAIVYGEVRQCSSKDVIETLNRISERCEKMLSHVKSGCEKDPSSCQRLNASCSNSLKGTLDVLTATAKGLAHRQSCTDKIHASVDQCSRVLASCLAGAGTQNNASESLL